MIATEPAWKPQINRSEPPAGSIGERPAVKSAVRALNIVGGVAVAAVAFVFVGLVAALSGCVGDESTGICVDHAGLVPVLEWAIFLTAVIAPLAGGIVAFIRREVLWLLAGTVTAGAMFYFMVELANGQTGLLN
jgi:hypothetical protein